MDDFYELADRAAQEIARATQSVDPAALTNLVRALASAKRIAVYGVGREGIMMRALTMRLYHMGLDVHMVGDMTTPPVGAGDLLLVSAGPGHLSTVEALIDVAKQAGARTFCITATPDGQAPMACDQMLVIRAQTMANDLGGTSVLPMGSLFEGAQFLTFELLILVLRDHLGVTPDAMRARHTNLE